MIGSLATQLLAVVQPATLAVPQLNPAVMILTVVGVVCAALGVVIHFIQDRITADTADHLSELRTNAIVSTQSPS